MRTMAEGIRAAFSAAAATWLSAAGTPVTRMEVVGPTLDDVFLELTGRSFRESNETTQTETVTEGAAA